MELVHQNIEPPAKLPEFITPLLVKVTASSIPTKGTWARQRARHTFVTNET